MHVNSYSNLNSPEFKISKQWRPGLFDVRPFPAVTSGSQALPSHSCKVFWVVLKRTVPAMLPVQFSAVSPNLIFPLAFFPGEPLSPFCPWKSTKRGNDEGMRTLGEPIFRDCICLNCLFTVCCNIEKTRQTRQTRQSKYVGRTNLHPVVTFNSLLSLLTLKMKEIKSQ